MIDILYITLIASIPYIYSKIREHYYEKLEFYLIEDLKDLSKSLENGNSIESALKEVSMKKDIAGKIIRGALKSALNGEQLEDTLRLQSKKNKSIALEYLAYLVKMENENSGDVSESAKRISIDLNKFHEERKSFNNEIEGPMFALQILIILAIPYSLAIISGILDVEIFFYSKAFLVGCVIIYSSLDYFIKGDILKSLFKIPFFLSLYFLSTTVIAPMVTKIIA